MFHLFLFLILAPGPQHLLHKSFLIALRRNRFEMSVPGSWHDEINDKRKGATYFLSQTGRPCFKPVDYIKYRALELHQSSVLVDEWCRWMHDLKKSRYEAVRRAAIAAPALTKDDIILYYFDRTCSERELDALESSRNQLQVADQLHTSSMKSRLLGGGTSSVLSDVDLATPPPSIDQAVSKENNPLERLKSVLEKRDRDWNKHYSKRPTTTKNGHVEDSDIMDNSFSVSSTESACQNPTKKTEDLCNATSQPTMGWLLQQIDNLADVYDYDSGLGDEQNDQEKVDPSPTKKRKASKKFDDDRRRSLQRRYTDLGDKWTLKSGTVVEDVLLNAGMKLKEFHPIHSFMLDLSDKYTKELFSQEDWIEICSDLPDVPPYSEKASGYLDQFENVATLYDLAQLLEKRPQDIESQLIHGCLLDWLDLFEMDNPSPFDVVDKLSENWWLESAWGVATKLAKHVPGCFVIPGELTGLDSSARRNDGRESFVTTERKKLGARADLLWRKLTTPETDWAIAEAAKVWCPHSNKYICESKFKLPRQLHDVLIGRTIEAGGARELRDVFACGLIIGGPCIQRIALCWGTSGDNVTRIVKFEPARLHANVKQLSSSIEAVHELLCFRVKSRTVAVLD